MDIMMLGAFNGLETTKILKHDPETKDCPIIMLTAKGQDFVEPRSDSRQIP
jgi:CheY-like chemotaxis protein